MGLENAKLVGFVASTDLARSRQFYVGRLGLQLIDDSPYACVLSANGVMVRVTLVEEWAEAPYTTLGWDVEDLGSAVADLAGRGISFERYEGMEQDGLAIWTAPGGAKVAWFRDPDGNTLSLTQFA